MFRLGQYERHIRYLYETARSGTMRAASEKLNVATSSVSRQIAFLESELGLPLIERGRRVVKLTEAGVLLADYYREKVAHDEAFVSQIQELRGNRAGQVTLAIGEGFIGEVFSEILKQFSKTHPHVSLSVRIAGSNEVLNAIREDDAHIGMVFHAPPDPKIRSVLTLSQPLKIITAPDDPLTNLEAVTLQDLAGRSLALPERGFRIRQLLEPAEMQAGEALAPTLVTNSLSLLKQFARTRQGVTVLTDIVVIDELRDGSLVALPLGHPELEKTKTQFVTRVGRLLPSPVVDLLRTIEVSLRSFGIETKRS